MAKRMVETLSETDAATADEQAGHSLLSIFATPEGLADPSPFFNQMRSGRPVFVGEVATVLTRFEDCKALLRDNRFGNGNRRPLSLTGDEEATAYREQMQDQLGKRPDSMLFLDPPDHTRQRSLVSRAFTPRRIEALRSEIRAMTNQRLDDLADASTGDAMELLAEPLPVSVISMMLGVPESDWPEIRSQVTDVAAVLEPTASLDELTTAYAAGETLWAYFSDLVAKRRATPTDDLLSALVATRDADDKLTDGEVIAVVQLLFAAGSETTTNLVGNGINALLDNPAQMAELWSDPSLVPNLVEEILRFDSPVQLDGRTCLEPVEVFEVRFEPGDRVMTLLGAANRDPQVNPDPDRFDLRRSNPSYLSFGSGIHYCLGANLARVEGEEVFAALVERFASIEAAGERPYRRRTVLRGLERCPITVTAR